MQAPPVASPQPLPPTCPYWQDLVSIVRSKAHRRRAVGSFGWTLGPGLSVAVKMYQMLQAARIPPVRAYLSVQLLCVPACIWLLPYGWGVGG